jgi:hypothetical protein
VRVMSDAYNTLEIPGFVSRKAAISRISHKVASIDLIQTSDFRLLSCIGMRIDSLM